MNVTKLKAPFVAQTEPPKKEKVIRKTSFYHGVLKLCDEGERSMPMFRLRWMPTYPGAKQVLIGQQKERGLAESQYEAVVEAIMGFGCAE